MKSISEEHFNEDFSMLCGLHRFHVDKKKIALQNEDIQCNGIKPTPHSCEEMGKMKWKNIQLNHIEYSSSEKSKNVRHLLWAFRCLNAHGENIKEVIKNGFPCYRIESYSQNNRERKRQPILMGYVERKRWKPFIEEIMNKIINAEKNETD